jgi:pimeloyl-ACP methyl ester carboxylesterase
MRRFASLIVGCSFVASCGPRLPQVAPVRLDLAGVPTPLANATDEYFDFGDVRFHYRETGTGQPVILLHGFSRSIADWSGLGDSLARDHRVIVLDERGHGQSTHFTDPARYGRGMADDVIRLMDHLHLQRAHLVGHSMGAAVAANAAVRHPDRVASVVLLAPPSFPDSSAFAQADAPWVADLEAGRGMAPLLMWLFPHWPDSTATRASAEALTTNNPATLAAVLRAMGGLMVAESQVARARVAMVAAAGSRDPLLPNTRWIASRWPNARMIEVPDADHGNVVSDPVVLAAIRHLSGGP